LLAKLHENWFVVVDAVTVQAFPSSNASPVPERMTTEFTATFCDCCVLMITVGEPLVTAALVIVKLTDVFGLLLLAVIV